LSWELRTRVEFDRAIKKLDKPIRQRVLASLHEVAALEDPRSRGKGLTGRLSGLWRYRVGDYRVEVEILDAEIVIVAVNVGHRSEIYG